MKIRADEHVSPQIVETICGLCLSAGWTFDHVNHVGDRGASDVHWMNNFAADGGQAVLTADTDFTSRPPQVVAVARTGMKIMLLPSRWAQAKRSLQTAHILFWWPQIEAKLHEMKARECVTPRWHLDEKKVAFQKVEINFSRAEKRLKHAQLNP